MNNQWAGLVLKSKSLKLASSSSFIRFRLRIGTLHKKCFMQIWSHLLNKSLMENLIFCAVGAFSFDYVQLFLQNIQIKGQYLINEMIYTWDKYFVCSVDKNLCIFVRAPTWVLFVLINMLSKGELIINKNSMEFTNFEYANVEYTFSTI